MSGRSQAYAPRFKDLRSIALAWWYQYKGIQICIEMNRLVL
jgi:hypothetical protein